MNILDHVKDLQGKVANHGSYQSLADKSGVGFHWLQKFATGSIPNPTVANVAKLDAYFKSISQD